MSVELGQLTISAADFQAIGRLLDQVCGIQLTPGKERLVVSRLAKRLRALELDTFGHYLDYLARDSTREELLRMVDVLTTNKTSFFREPQHFDYLCRHILPAVRGGESSLRLWCAGCSTGEEPYTIGILLRESVPDLDRRDVRILATDISTRVLTKARAAIYDEETVSTISPERRQRYLVRVQEQGAPTYQVHPSVRSLVRLARLNLMEEWPMKGPFDVIFCRNVMIYFDAPTRERLVQRYWQMLRPGGHFFVGHSESLSSLATSFRYVQPAVYVK